MALANKIGVAILAVIAALLIQTAQDLTKQLPFPKLDKNQYWGSKNQSTYKEDTTIRKFNVTASDNVINELKRQLDVAVIPESLHNSAFNYGFNSKELNKIVKYWKDTYLKNWSAREKYFNQFHHFTTQIQGLKIHFIRVKPKQSSNTTIYPILLLHGWPGSIREFYDIIPKLTKKQPDTSLLFEVVVPSLPGFGWSQGTKKQGFGPTEHAIVLRNLMLRLGHEKFFIQGGDFGSKIGSDIATIFPENVLGYHSNLCASNTGIAFVKQYFGSFFAGKLVGKQYINWYYPLKLKLKFLLGESGYYHIQATKPDTIGTALSNNPVGLAAYILEKFSTWTNSSYVNITNGGLSNSFKYDQLLDNVMVYYLTNSITTSVRIYYETQSEKALGYNIDRFPVTKPVACARFRNEILHFTNWALSDKYPKLIQTSYHEKGGHFAALELPDILYKDLINFVKKVV